MKKNELVVVLISGGMDSCVTAAIADLAYRLAFLHLNYGQRTEARELKAFADIAQHYGVEKKLVVDMHFFHKIGGSSLTDSSMQVSKADLNSEKIPTSYVPFRNANILAIATSWAEVIGATKIYIGAVEEDSSGYPDCRSAFFKTFNQLIREGTKPSTKISVITPLIDYSKSDIVERGIELQAPLHLTWSCYQSEEKACGVCDSCALRLRGFARAGARDPLPYKKRPHYA